MSTQEPCFYCRRGMHSACISGEVACVCCAQSEPPTYGMCLACRSVEVALIEVTGTRDFSNIGEHPAYPVGYGCEACS